MTCTKSLNYDSGSSELELKWGLLSTKQEREPLFLTDFLMYKLKVLFFAAVYNVIFRYV